MYTDLGKRLLLGSAGEDVVETSRTDTEQVEGGRIASEADTSAVRSKKPAVASSGLPNPGVRDLALLREERVGWDRAYPLSPALLGTLRDHEYTPAPSLEASRLHQTLALKSAANAIRSGVAKPYVCISGFM